MTDLMTMLSQSSPFCENLIDRNWLWKVR